MYRCADVIVSYEITNNYYSNARNCSDLRFCQSGRIAFDWFAIVGFCCCGGFFVFSNRNKYNGNKKKNFLKMVCFLAKKNNLLVSCKSNNKQMNLVGFLY